MPVPGVAGQDVRILHVLQVTLLGRLNLHRECYNQGEPRLCSRISYLVDVLGSPPKRELSGRAGRRGRGGRRVRGSGGRPAGRRCEFHPPPDLKSLLAPL